MSHVISHCAECGRAFLDDFAAPRLWCSVYCETQPARFAAVEAHGAAAERAAVVAALRRTSHRGPMGLSLVDLDAIADAIERGEHRR
jgi:hypothetical protein